MSGGTLIIILFIVESQSAGVITLQYSRWRKCTLKMVPPAKKLQKEEEEEEERCDGESRGENKTQEEELEVRSSETKGQKKKRDSGYSYQMYITERLF